MTANSFTTCLTCGEFDRAVTHMCLPVFEFIIPEQGDDWPKARLVRALDHEEAATEGLYQLCRDGGAEASDARVLVRRQGEKVIRAFDVRHEVKVEFRASEVAG